MRGLCPRSLAELLKATGASLYRGDAAQTLSGLAVLRQATSSDLCYCLPKFRRLLATTKAGAVIVTLELAPLVPQSCAVLVCDKPRLAWAVATDLFVERPALEASIDPSAKVAASASIGLEVSIAAGAVVAKDARLEDRVVIGENCVVGAGVVIKKNSRLAANVTCYPGVVIGEECLLHSGVVLGADGFGFEPDEHGVWHKIAQIGGVHIGNRVEIGANSTVDCGAVTATQIGNGVKLDNLVQIGHGCVIGDNCLLCAGSLVGGSVTMESGCILAGANTIKYGVRLVSGTIVGGSTTITRSTSEPGEYLALFPAKKRRDWLQFIRLVGRRSKSSSIT